MRLTVHYPHLEEHTVEAELWDNGRGYIPGYGVLAGRTATVVRAGSLNIFRASDAKQADFEAHPEHARRHHPHAYDEDGNLYFITGVSASGNKGTHGYRVVGHTEAHGVELTSEASR